MLFSEVIGQRETAIRMAKAAREGRVSHAQLFHGPAGTGKLALALAYARYINCQNRSEKDACGTCPSCIKISKLIHPDVHFVFPVITPKEGSSKAVSDYYLQSWREAVIENPYMNENQWYEKLGAENKQGFISRQESTEVLRKLSLKSYEAEYKVLIVWHAEKMNAPAANSLLKLLEEPPDKTVFLLTTEQTELILPTILSRTQMIRIPRIEEEEIRKGLSSHFPDAGEAIGGVVRRANGSFGDALVFMEQEDQDHANFEEFVFLMRRCYSRDIIALNKWTEKMAAWGREGLKHFLSYSLRMIRENFILHLKQDQISYLSTKEKEFSERFSAFIHLGNVFRIAEEFELAAEHIEANGSPKLVLLDLAIKNILLLKEPAPVD